MQLSTLGNLAEYLAAQVFMSGSGMPDSSKDRSYDPLIVEGNNGNACMAAGRRIFVQEFFFAPVTSFKRSLQ